MANLADQSGNLLESQKGYDPRVIVFHLVMALLLLVLAGGLAYQQLVKAAEHHSSERVQSQRRILMPGPRGDIYDRNGRLLVGNHARFSVVLYLDELRDQFRREYIAVRKNYRATGDKDVPSIGQMQQIARVTVVQRYLDKINAILGRQDRVDARELNRHYARELLLPYPLVDDLSSDDFAKLLVRLPVDSPLQVLASSARFYPYGSLACHVLGYVGTNEDIAADDLPGDDLRTFTFKGATGRSGLEKEYNATLTGDAGGAIYRVDPSGIRINPPLQRREPVQGRSITTTLDVDLQQAAEDQLNLIGNPGAAVALDVETGEVLALASMPGYNLNDFTPSLSHAASKDIEQRGAWFNRAVNGTYPPGSTFKILSTIAGLRSGAINPDQPIIDCEGVLDRYGRRFVCENGRGHHGEVLLPNAIAESCDIYFYQVGWLTTPATLAAEAHRFHLDQPTGIDLPFEAHRMLIPTADWKIHHFGQQWFPGDTANMAIGQGYVLLTPLQMACFAASVARGETYTVPTLLHRADAPVQHTPAIGLTPVQRQALITGMIGCTTFGTAKILTELPSLRIPGVTIAGKTGTAQIPGAKNVAWFICFAPAENPRIAVAVAVEGVTAGENFGGGRYAAPVASAILQAYFHKHPPAPAAANTLALTR